NKWFVGYPISVAYDYQFGGIWQIQDSVRAHAYGSAPGKIRVVDQNGDGKIDQNDRIILGTTFPRWTTSMTSRLDWKGIDLSVMAVAGHGSVITVRTITVGYTITGGRLRWMRARSLRIYASALDPFMFTQFRGLDPESALNSGVPSYRTLMMGVTLGI